MGCVICAIVTDLPIIAVLHSSRPAAIQSSNISGVSAMVDKNTTTGNTLDTGTDQYVVFNLGSNYTVTAIRLYTDGNSYTWNVSLGNDTTEATCCNYSD